MEWERKTEAADRLLRRFLTVQPDAATAAVLEAAMRAAIDVTHECGEPTATDDAAFTTFRETLAFAAEQINQNLTLRRR
jgi:hypothetical protein